MSYILDALNKSEQERKSNQAPNLDTIHRTPGAPRAGGTPWLLVLVVIIILNTIFAIYWFSTRPDPAPAEVAAPVQPEPEELPQPIVEQFEPAPTKPVFPESAIETVEQGQLITPDDYFRREMQPQPTIEPPPVRFSALPLNIQQQIPEIDISSHIYGSDPAFRMASINGQIVREGDMVTNDIRLDEITEDGVVLQYLHYRFEMRIQ